MTTNNLTPNKSSNLIIQKITLILGVIFSTLTFTYSPQQAHAEDIGDIKKLHDFLELDQIYTNINDIHANNFTNLTIEKKPWTDTFWPDLLGSVAHAYNQRGAPGYVFGWFTGLSYLRGRQSLYASIPNMSAYEIDNLSPAEKYDLLIGDTDFTFSRAVSQMVFDRKSTGITSTWTGICHGWSPASIYYDRPARAVTVTGRLGHKITFYPSDIKGLMSFLWAKSYAQNFTKLEGWQCPYKKDRHTQTWTSRLLDPKCFDVNPAFFHLAMVNQFAINKKALIIDRSYQRPVWNQPVHSYTYTYYNPKNRMISRTVEDARIKIGYRGVDFPEFRSERAKSIVGVEMIVGYAKEDVPNHEKTNGPQNDMNDTMYFYYTLELDANDNIIGGEWTANAPSSTLGSGDGEVDMRGWKMMDHPDIIWRLPNNLKAYSVADSDIASMPWNGYGQIPEAYVAASKKASAVIDQHDYNLPRPQPLAAVVDGLINLAK